jgi:hypothetical protein
MVLCNVTTSNVLFPSDPWHYLTNSNIYWYFRFRNAFNSWNLASNMWVHVDLSEMICNFFLLGSALRQVAPEAFYFSRLFVLWLYTQCSRKRSIRWTNFGETLMDSFARIAEDVQLFTVMMNAATLLFQPDIWIAWNMMFMILLRNLAWVLQFLIRLIKT